MMLWRVDYAATEHGTWLSKEDELFSDPEAAIKRAQTLFERWDRSCGWRIVPRTMPIHEKIIPEHHYKIIDELGQHLMPWSLQPWPGRERHVARAA